MALAPFAFCFLFSVKFVAREFFLVYTTLLPSIATFEAPCMTGLVTSEEPCDLAILDWDICSLACILGLASYIYG